MNSDDVINNVNMSKRGLYNIGIYCTFSVPNNQADRGLILLAAFKRLVGSCMPTTRFSSIFLLTPTSLFPLLYYFTLSNARRFYSSGKEHCHSMG